jgi:hypothetical protein
MATRDVVGAGLGPGVFAAAGTAGWAGLAGLGAGAGAVAAGREEAADELLGATTGLLEEATAVEVEVEAVV